MLSIVNSPQCRSFTQVLSFLYESWTSLLPWSSILTLSSFASIKHLDLLFFCLDQASWPSISVSNWARFVISFLILHLCIVCVDSANVFKCPACERERGMWERESVCVDSANVFKCPACERERECERKCPTARVCGKA